MFNNSSTSSDRSAERRPMEEVALSYQIVVSLLLGTLILCAIFGNACVVAAIALERHLQTVANYLIGSLAVTDLMVSVLVLPMAALYQVLNKWTLGQVTCDIFISLDVLCCTSSILHLCAIALDRYWAITDPIDYVNKRTPRRAAILISITWAVGFSISIPPMLGWRTPEDRSDPDACKISEDPGYTIYSTFGAFYIPLILMLILYGRIFKAARFRIRKTVKKNEKRKKVAVDTGPTNELTTGPTNELTTGPTNELTTGQTNELTTGPTNEPATGRNGSPPGTQRKSNGEPGGGKNWKRSVEPKPVSCVNGAIRHGEEVIHYANSKNHLSLPNHAGETPCCDKKNDKSADAKRKVALARERKTVKTLGIIMGTFIFCWLPFFIVALVLPFCESCHMPHLLYDVINWLGYSNSLLNPIIYAYFNKDFQSAFKKIIKCKFCRQ